MRERRFRPTADGRLEPRALPSATAIAPPSPVVPAERTDAYATLRHEQDLGRGAEGGANVVFLGDSITDFFGDAGRAATGGAVWDRAIAPLGAANFGVSGDLTGNVLWRIGAGELASQPKVVVVEIGTNNLGWGDTPAQTAQGVEAVVAAIRAESPGSQVLLMGLLPRGLTTADPFAPEIPQVNALLAGLADGVHVHYINIGAAFLEPNGTVNPALMPDGIHPSAAGYAIWADAIAGPLRSMLAASGVAPATTTAQTPGPATSSRPTMGKDAAILADAAAGPTQGIAADVPLVVSLPITTGADPHVIAQGPVRRPGQVANEAAALAGA